MSRDHQMSHLDRQAEQAMLENGFEPNFSREFEREVAEIRSRPPAGEPDIKDMRSVLWSSIDNASSRDLDQIEWAEHLENGDIRVLVGIADVSASVDRGSAIDAHAEKNTVTVYTQTRIFPMLPEELSTDLTSLVEGRDRLAVVADMTVKADGSVPESTFYRAVVNNHAKLAYEDVGPWLDGQSGVPASVSRVDGLQEQLELQEKAAERLQDYRTAKGALSFESIESSVVMEDGHVKAIVSVESNAARKLIENFMVAANVEMAEYLENRGALSIGES